MNDRLNRTPDFSHPICANRYLEVYTLLKSTANILTLEQWRDRAIIPIPERIDATSQIIINHLPSSRAWQAKKKTC